eukprot:CAMPEP_0115006142 /NCGR_PEP_ID=MMETSP0216-20121206/20307_1 /TAXON_ID=223996 /ORGANISM="Protocruzia adherens, Strain Boccale" /LENGTH=224 /DNA_ID=CAMNT_0002372635 /DNA_START=1161 /DNA_END=1835 /DNA_ORIENTATION=+
MVNVPMFLCLRRTVCFFVLVNDFGRTGRLPQLSLCACIGLIVMGTLVAGYNDLTYDPLGYCFVIVNNILSTVQMQTAKNMNDEDTKVDALSMLFLNSINITPVLLAISLYVGDFGILYEAVMEKEVAFSFMMILSASMGVSITYFYLLCSIYNSPMATSITGNVKDIFLTALSFMAFADVQVNNMLITGLVLSLMGALTYSYAKISATKAAAAAAAAAAKTKKD